MFVLGIVISFEIVGRLELFTDTSTLYGEKIDISDVSQMPAICVYIYIRPLHFKTNKK